MVAGGLYHQVLVGHQLFKVKEITKDRLGAKPAGKRHRIVSNLECCVTAPVVFSRLWRSISETQTSHYETKRARLYCFVTNVLFGLHAANGNQLQTAVWGYGLAGGPVTYPGPTFVAKEHVKVRVTWRNKLPLEHLLPVDVSVHWAHPSGNSGIPAVTHLHGGHTESASDGLPEAWFTRNFAETGPHFVKAQYNYDNDQEAATLWYHDHALGITRLNVYAGLAGFNLLRDNNENKLTRKHVLPTEPYEIEIVIQDRMFTDDGELFYPVEPEVAAAPNPSVLPEFFGDFILVNGMAWPKLEVEQRKYRLRLLNGSDSRFYVLEFRDDRFNGSAQRFFQIGTDVGFLPSTEIRFQIPTAGTVELKIFNALGEEIRTLVRAEYAAGHHEVRWDGKDNRGNVVACGAYLYQLRVGDFLAKKKMTLLR